MVLLDIHVKMSFVTVARQDSIRTVCDTEEVARDTEVETEVRQRWQRDRQPEV